MSDYEDNDYEDNDYEDNDYEDPMNKDIIDEDDPRKLPNRLIPINKKRPLIPFTKKTTLFPPNPPITSEPKKIKTAVKSNFFTKTIIDSYLLNISSQLTNKTIMNLDQLFEYFGGQDKSNYQLAIQIRTGIIKENICSYIQKTFIEQVLERAVEQSHNYMDYDIVFIVDTTIDNKIKEIEKTIISFVIVQRRECPKFENAYALNLICSRKCYSCGNILIGLYLYTVLCHPKTSKLRIEQIIPESDLNSEHYGPPILHLGLLEIGGGYKNINALCLYTKFGFKVNANLSGRESNCFIDDNNIAMIKRFNSDENIKNDDIFDNIIRDTCDIEQEKEKILKIVRKEESRYKKHIICEFKDKHIQHLLGELYNKNKNIQKIYAKLVIQSKWAINKIGNEFTPDFKSKISPVEKEMNDIKEQINRIETSSRDIKIEDLDINGGNIKKRKPRKTKKNKKILKSNKRLTKHH